MYKSDEINLIKTEYTKDKISQEVEGKKKKEIYCDIESITWKEWHDAGRNGLKPEFKITAAKHDYENEKFVEIDGEEYAVYRTYNPKNSDDIELYVTQKGGITCQQ